MATPFETFHETVVRDVFKGPVSDHEAMAIMAVLHHFQIGVKPGVLSDTPLRVIHALTQRSASACVAGLWSGMDDERSNYVHWYWEWNTKVCAEEQDSLPDWLRERYAWAKAKIEAHPDVEMLVLED